jgi:hypothetical protein
MSRNLTQPEEIDQILWAMVTRELEQFMPILGETPLIGDNRSVPHEGFATGTNYINGIEHKKSEQGLPSLQQYVRHVE